MPNLSNLTKLKKNIVTKYIINFIKRRFPSKLIEVANIANSLRVEHNIDYISLN
jgi:hypothetical protein